MGIVVSLYFDENVEFPQGTIEYLPACGGHMSHYNLHIKGLHLLKILRFASQKSRGAFIPQTSREEPVTHRTSYCWYCTFKAEHLKALQASPSYQDTISTVTSSSSYDIFHYSKTKLQPIPRKIPREESRWVFYSLCTYLSLATFLTPFPFLLPSLQSPPWFSPKQTKQNRHIPLSSSPGLSASTGAPSLFPSKWPHTLLCSSNNASALPILKQGCRPAFGSLGGAGREEMWICWPPGVMSNLWLLFVSPGVSGFKKSVLWGEKIRLLSDRQSPFCRRGEMWYVWRVDIGVN